MKKKEVDKDAINYVFNNSKIIDEASIDISISSLKFLLEKTKRKIYDWDNEYNEIIFYNDNESYIIVKSKDFINKFIKQVFSEKLDENDIENINKYVIKNGEKVRKEDYNDQIKERERVEYAMNSKFNNFI